jgi:predicted Holliday junction resolvase-like endonuclease
MTPLLIVLLIFAAVIVVILLIRLAQTRSELTKRIESFQTELNQRLQLELENWRTRELDSLRAQLTANALAQARTELEKWQIEKEEEIRKDAAKRSSAVVLGKVTEHLAPYMSTFPFNPRDARFIGTPIDLLVFDGLEADHVRQIIFMEVKSAGSTLTTRERSVRDAVREGRVMWHEFRVSGE